MRGARADPAVRPVCGQWWPRSGCRSGTCVPEFCVGDARDQHGSAGPLGEPKTKNRTARVHGSVRAVQNHGHAENNFIRSLAQALRHPKAGGSAAGGQPSGKVAGALEIEQGFRQGLKLLQG
jgi:hypothetical protein